MATKHYVDPTDGSNFLFFWIVKLYLLFNNVSSSSSLIGNVTILSLICDFSNVVAFGFNEQ